MIGERICSPASYAEDEAPMIREDGVHVHRQNVLIREKRRSKIQKHTTGGIPRWSPTLVLVARFSAYVWQSGRDAQFSLTYGRMCDCWSHVPS
jgi:hypothetical protein